jgi:hypothetical protein
VRKLLEVIQLTGIYHVVDDAGDHVMHATLPLRNAALPITATTHHAP